VKPSQNLVAPLRAKLVSSFGALVALLFVAARLSGLGLTAPTVALALAATLLVGWLVTGRLLEPLRKRVEASEETRTHLEGDSQDRERRERAARQGQTMAAVGRLAGAVAHEFNDRLSIILGYSGIALDGMRAEDPLFVALSEIKHAGERSAELTRRLLSLSHNQIVETKTVDAAPIVDKMARSIRRVLGENRAFDLTCDSSPCLIQTARGQIEQLVMSLVINARDAMPEKGRLSIDIRRVEISVKDAEHEVGLEPGRYVRLRVTDTGVGMTPAVQERIFEPFFTTKSEGGAIGLGLTTVFGFVQQTGGHIGVRSAPGEGTTFDIHLPETPYAIASKELPSSGATRAARTILVVEDEEQVRVVVERILRRHRYGVLVAGSPQEAMSICQDHPGRIDLLVTDIAMPEMNGLVLAEQLLERRPEMKVLYLSGYMTEILLPKKESGDTDPFLQKPVTPDALRKKVRGILQASSIPPSHRGTA
jgi:two-component system, cell cycle sensor histidine kinase and response regulator CckA